METKTKAKEIVEKITIKFNRLQKRQKTYIFFFIVAVLLGSYYNLVYKPQSDALREAQTEWENINNRLMKLKSQMPDIEKEKEALDIAKNNLDSLKRQLSFFELQLPTQGSIPQLLGELVRQAQGYSIDFVSIAPKTNEKNKKEYAQFVVEMKFNSNYSDFTNYLNRLESLSQFLRVTGITIEEMKDGFQGESNMTLVLETLLGEETQIKSKEPKELKFVAPLIIKRDPFLSNFKPVEAVKKEEFRLDGIIAGQQPTAIINDEVYRRGDIIGSKKDKKVKQILPNMVILTDGRENTVLMLQRE